MLVSIAMTSHRNDSSRSVRRTAEEDARAREALFAEHCERLKRVVRIRIHPRLHGRIDESDVVQEVLLEASRQLTEHAQDPPLSFFLWLRQIATHKLVDLHRRHLGAARRDARLEVSLHGAVSPAATSAALAAQLLAGLTSPSSAAIKKETRRLVQEALQSMDPIDCEVLMLRHFERLTNGEAAHVLEISESACSNRYVRALARLKKILNGVPGLF